MLCPVLGTHVRRLRVTRALTHEMGEDPDQP